MYTVRKYTNKLIPILPNTLIVCPKSTDTEDKTKIYIKNMVSSCCKKVVKAELDKLGLNYSTVELGEAELIGSLTEQMKMQLKENLRKLGLDLMEEKSMILVERIKNIVVEMVHNSDEQPLLKFSEFLSEKLNHSYCYLANLFAEVKGIPIQQFIILHKIERVKEMLVFEDYSLSEIAWKLHYSSVAHLSTQFKKTTGLTPTHFRNMKEKRLTPLEDL